MAPRRGNVAERDAKVRERARDCVGANVEEPLDSFRHVRDIAFSREVATMTTPTEMYQLRRVFDLPATYPQSRSMYKMRSIHGDGREDRRPSVHDADSDDQAKMSGDAVLTQVISLLQAPLPEYGALEARQEKILGQLAELKKQVSTLCHFLKQSNQIETTKDFVTVKKPVHAKIVIHVNPCKPPYSILALQRYWKDTRIRVSSYLHSTATAPIPLIFPDTPIADTESCNGVNVLELILIWKDVEEMKFIMDKYEELTYIIGEINFLRYVSRLIESHSYEKTILQTCSVNEALDSVYMLQFEKCIIKGLHKLANTFEKWSCNEHGEFNIADIAVWSLIKQIQFAETSLPLPLKKWYALCEEAFIGENLTR